MARRHVHASSGLMTLGRLLRLLMLLLLLQVLVLELLVLVLELLLLLLVGRMPLVVDLQLLQQIQRHLLRRRSLEGRAATRVRERVDRGRSRKHGWSRVMRLSSRCADTNVVSYRLNPLTGCGRGSPRVRV